MYRDRISSAQFFTINNKKKKSFSVPDKRKSHPTGCKKIVRKRRKSFFVTTMNYCFCFAIQQYFIVLTKQYKKKKELIDEINDFNE
jgi:hypothetical protein